jgi:hypothetical protein
MRGVVVVLIALVLALPLDAAAQGRGRPKQPRPAAGGATTTTPTPTAAAAAAAENPGGQPSVPAFRQFGTWLDDASAAAAGTGWTGIGAGYWRIPGGSQIDVPILSAAVGVANRVQLSATVPFYRINYLGSTARGLDDVYLGGKLVAIDPATGDGRFGLAFSPLVEILSAGTPGGRVHWALPVSAEVRGDATRFYASAGYFSRGAVFTGAALEWTAPAGTMLTGALTQSLSTSEVSAGVPGTGRNRVDAMVTVGHPVTAAMSAYASIGRTLTSIDEGGTTLGLTGGIVVGF